jgi:hypothetical protein
MGQAKSPEIQMELIFPEILQMSQNGTVRRWMSQNNIRTMICGIFPSLAVPNWDNVERKGKVQILCFFGENL